MGEIVARLRAAGEVVSDEDLARISPLAYAHVIPNGTYVFDHSRRGHIAPDTLLSVFSDLGLLLLIVQPALLRDGDSIQ
jgi:Tn3 transposase DDE domain